RGPCSGRGGSRCRSAWASLSGQEGGDPADEGVEAAGLDVDAAAAAQLGDEALARGDEAHQAAARAAHVQLEAALEGDEVPGVDEVAAVDLDGVDAAVALKEELPVAADLEAKGALAGQHGAQAGEADPDVEGAAVGEVGAGAQEEGLP